MSDQEMRPHGGPGHAQNAATVQASSANVALAGTIVGGVHYHYASSLWSRRAMRATLVLSMVAAGLVGLPAPSGPAPKQPAAKAAESSTTSTAPPAAPEARQATSPAVETTVTTITTTVPPSRPAPATTATTTAAPPALAQPATTAAAAPAPQAGPAVEVSRGPASDKCGGDNSNCYQIHIRMWGFEPDAEFKVVPYSSEWDDFNPGATLTIDANGTEDFNRFHCKPAGQDVWVVVTIGDQTYTSNRFRWPG